MRPLARHLCASLLGLALALLSAGPAAAQFLGQPRGIISPMAGEPRGDGRITGPTPVFSASFATPGAFASGFASDTGQAITVARASTATYLVNGVLTTAAANTLRVQSYSGGARLGALIEQGSTNGCLQYNALTTAPWTATSGVTLNSTTWLDGTVTMAKVDNTAGGIGTGPSQSGCFSASTGPFSAAMWFKPVHASDSTRFIAFWGGGINASTCTCTCANIDGTSCSCTPSISTVNCIVDVTVSQAARVTATTTPAASAAPGVAIVPGTAVATGQIYAGGAQGEQLLFSTSDIPTTSTAASRSADRVTMTTPFALGAKSMCMQADVIVNGLNAGSGFNLFAEPYIDGSNLWFFGVESTPKLRLNGFFSATSHVALSGGSLSLNTATHVVARYDGVNETVCLNGVCTQTAFSYSAPTAFTGIVLGDDFGGAGANVLNGTLKNLRLYANAGSCQ